MKIFKKWKRCEYCAVSAVACFIIAFMFLYVGSFRFLLGVKGNQVDYSAIFFAGFGECVQWDRRVVIYCGIYIEKYKNKNMGYVVNRNIVFQFWIARDKWERSVHGDILKITSNKKSTYNCGKIAINFIKEFIDINQNLLYNKL